MNYTDQRCILDRGGLADGDLDPRRMKFAEHRLCDVLSQPLNRFVLQRSQKLG